MHWSRRRQLRRDQEREQLLEQLELLHRMLLLSALTPLAQALQRQDSLLVSLLREQEALLLEILQASSPSQRQQLELDLGLDPFRPR
jgi:hypothetical protein